jgi:hypothetical protein
MNQCIKIKLIVLCLLIFISQANIIKATEKNKRGTKASSEFKERGGVPNFFTKAFHGDSITVAYFGGSITAQEGYRVLSFNWFQKQFPNAKFHQVNAAIGGTGSKFGVFRLQEHVLKYKPDLVFVEFAVNDGGQVRDQILRSMEGIVREIWKQNPKTDICFVYTMCGGFVSILEKQQLPTQVLAMEEVAQHYGIPSINYQIEVSKRLQNHSLILMNKEKQVNGIQVFSPDGVHPYVEAGHGIYFDVLKRSFDKMDQRQGAKTHKLIKPLYPNFFAHAHMIEPGKALFSGDWHMLDSTSNKVFRFKKLISHVAQSHQTGATMHLKFKGPAIGFCDIIGPDAGRVIVEIDGSVKDTIYRFDKYCTYFHLNNYIVENLKDAKHDVVFCVLADPIDKVKILKQMGNEMKNPDDFKENNWSVSKILIDGELIP